MVRAEPTNNRTAGIDTNHSTMFTLLLELNVLCEQRWMQFELQNSPSRVFAFGVENKHYHLANLWNRITTEIFGVFWIITLKQKTFFSPIQSWSSNFQKNCSPIQTCSAKIGFSPDLVLSSGIHWSSCVSFGVFPIVRLAKDAFMCFTASAVF